MPNGGSDCCGTCWFNSANDGEPGYPENDSDDPPNCTIRGFEIENPFWTYCANHPHHNPTRVSVPIGPVYVAGSYPYSRTVLHQSVDSEEIRLALLELLEGISEVPNSEYPSQTKFDEEIIKQLMSFRELRAVKHLRRIAGFDPLSTPAGENPFNRTRIVTVALAVESLGVIEMDAALDLLGPAIDSGLSQELVADYDGEKDRLAPIRYHAVLGLQHCDSEEAKSLLERATSDPHSEVSAFANELLAKRSPNT